MVTRRDFLKATAVVAAGTLVRNDAPALLLQRKPKVIVLGAGFAGLAAAYALRKRGHDVTILEARRRIGGRVFSHTIDEKENLVVELGAEWVGESHKRIITLCKEFGLELQNNQFATHLTYKGEYFPKGKWAYSPEWQSKWEQLMKDYRDFTDRDKKKLDKTDWWRLLMKYGISERDMDLRELIDSTDFGETIRSVSGYAALAEYAESSEHNEMDLKIKGGNSKLPEALADAIGRNNIKLDHEAISVVQSRKNVTVMCQVGGASEKLECDQLICAIPTFAVSNIDWQPSLPPDTQWGIDALQYARIIKVVVEFDERFWKDDDFDMVTDLYGHYFYNATKNQQSTKGVLTGYMIGDKADIIARQNETFKRQIILDSLKPAFGDVSTLITKSPVSYYWGNDKYSKGSYALYGKGQWYTVMPALKKRFQNVHFAGEHLADWQGFMEGAILSGEEAAEAVMD